MAGAAPGVSYGFKDGSAIAKSIVDKVKEIGNTIIFTGHSHFDMLRDQVGDGYVHTQELGNHCWMVHIPSCGWCKTGDGKGEANCIKDPYPEDTKFGKIYRSQGYVAEAYSDKVILKAYQFNTNEWLGDYVFDVTGVTNIVGASEVGKESKDPEIPAGEDYVAIDSVYVNSAYWRTDYNLIDGDILEWKGTLTKTSQFLIGSADSSKSKRFDLQYTSSNKIQAGFGNDSVGWINADVMDGQPHVLKLSSVDKKLYVDGTVRATSTQTFAKPTAPMKICSVGGTGYETDTTHQYIGRFFEATVYDSDGETMKHHWIPVYYNDGKYKLLDTVTNTFLEPTDSGDIRWKD